MCMIEMELKVRVKDRNRLIYLKNLLSNKNCQWSEKSFQKDGIFEKTVVDSKEKTPIFRIRESENKYILTLKQLDADKDTAEEIEVCIDNKEKMEQILHKLGYIQVCSMKKRRETTVYQGYTICLDEVEELGVFMEIEKLSSNSNQKDNVYAEIMGILRELGFDESDIEKEKYYQLLMK